MDAPGMRIIDLSVDGGTHQLSQHQQCAALVKTLTLQLMIALIIQIKKMLEAISANGTPQTGIPVVIGIPMNSQLQQCAALATAAHLIALARKHKLTLRTLEVMVALGTGPTKKLALKRDGISKGRLKQLSAVLAKTQLIQEMKTMWLLNENLKTKATIL